LRELQGEAILREIANGNVAHMIDSHLFLMDSLFCEWGYIIDLDSMLLRVYKGFNKAYDPDTTLPPDISNAHLKDGYYPVRELYTYDLNNLPEFMPGMTNEFKEQYRESQSLDC
jgi:hypothetical protein